MASDPERGVDWERVLRAQGVSDEMIAEARRSAARMVEAVGAPVADPREPLVPDAFAHQLAAMARARAKTPS